jgi:RNA polymerase sigma-70 factor, ECF subfamily
MSSLTSSELGRFAILNRECAEGNLPSADPVSIPESDESLLQSLSEGNGGALATLFGRYAAIVRGIACRVLQDTSEADDLLQDVFLVIHDKCRTFDPSRGPARHWILRLSYYHAISRRRYLQSRHFYARLDLDDASPLLSAYVAEPQLYEDSLEGILGSGALEALFDELTENQRQTFHMYFFEGYSLDEIAARLCQSRGNVKHHYFRGLEKLRKRIFRRNSGRG